MSRCVPSWDLEDVNPNHDIFRLEYEVAELKWENGQLAMHELGSRRVPSKFTWEKPRAAETLEAVVNQATLQPYCKTQAADCGGDNLVPSHIPAAAAGGGANASTQATVCGGDDLVPWHIPAAAAAGSGANAPVTVTSDALVPSSNNGGSSTAVGSCSGGPAGFVERKVAARGGGTAAEGQDWSESGTFVTIDTYDGVLDGRRRFDTSTGSPENTYSGKDYSKSTSRDDSLSHPRSQREATVIKEKERVKAKAKAKASNSNKRRRTPAIHNQSERKRRDKINERIKTLQKLVPNSSKTDKASMLEEIIEYVKQMQAYVHMISRMNMSPMMMPLAMQQHQMQMSMMNSMGMGMGMNTIGGSNIPTGFHPSTFLHMPLWNGHTNNRAVSSTVSPTDPMYTFLGCQPQPMNMDAYSRMATLYQHMQNQPCGPISKN